MSPLSESSLQDPALLKSALAKVTWRVIPFLFLLYIVAYLDRVNVSFAALQMKQDLHFSDEVYGVGAGIFFLGYFLFEIPSNLVMERVGARIWIARIMILWGVLAAAMAFVNSALSFNGMRFLLGVGEAGFFPGMILYLTYWFPATERARAIAFFMTATALSNVVGGPVSTQLLRLQGLAGLSGWQWLFVLEGIPATLLGIVVLFYLTDRPEQANWLTPGERNALIARLRYEQEHREQRGHHPSLKALLDPKVALLCAVYFCTVTGSYGISLWLPQIVKGFKEYHFSDQIVGLLAMIPYSCAAIFMVLNGLHSDKTGERRWHVALPVLMGAAGLVLSAYAKNPAVSLFALSLAAMGTSGYLGAFWALPTSFLGGTAAAGGIALINSVGNLGGFAGPFLIGAIKDRTHSFTIPLLTIAAIVALGAVLVVQLKHDRSLERPEAVQ